MSKTICWPMAFAKEVLSEMPGAVYLAVRPGALYYNAQYFTKGEIIDIRLDSEIIRKAVIYRDLKVLPIKKLTQVHYNLLKPQINTQETLMQYLYAHYKLPIDENTEITLIYYLNMNMILLKEN